MNKLEKTKQKSKGKMNIWKTIKLDPQPQRGNMDQPNPTQKI